MSRGGLLVVLTCLVHPCVAHAQSLAVEVNQAAGASSEEIAGAAAQVRLLGEVGPRLRFEVEGAWGDRTRGTSDVLGAAYPYRGRAEVIEAYAEYAVPAGRGIRSIRGGRYRTPFGFSAASDHAYVGFLRPPLIRYGDYFALSSGYLEHGVDVVVGVPRLWGEVSVGRPADVGAAIRRPGTNTTLRAQGTVGPLILGASFLDTTPYLPVRFARGRARFGGVDARWMRGGVQVRGEWLGGRPFDGTSTTGGYVDLIVHRPRMGPVTALARAERLDYQTTPPFALYTHRYSMGGRVRVWQGLAVSSGVSHQGGQLTQSRRTALDAGLSYTLRQDY
jgi:hypothetical protein